MGRGDGDVVRALAFYQCGLGSIPSGAIFLLSVLLAVALFRGFFVQLSGFPPSTKTNISNSNSIRIDYPRENQLRLIRFRL